MCVCSFFYDAGCFVVRSCVRSCIFCFVLGGFSSSRSLKRTTPPSFFFGFVFCFLFLRAQWMKWIIVARVATVCVVFKHNTLSLKHFGTWNREKRNSIRKGPAFRNGFTSKILVWCALLCLMFKVFFIKWPELMLMYFFVFFKKPKKEKRNVSHQESRRNSRVLFATLLNVMQKYIYLT